MVLPLIYTYSPYSMAKNTQHLSAVVACVHMCVFIYIIIEPVAGGVVVGACCHVSTHVWRRAGLSASTGRRCIIIIIVIIIIITTTPVCEVYNIYVYLLICV